MLKAGRSLYNRVFPEGLKRARRESPFAAHGAALVWVDIHALFGGKPMKRSGRCPKCGSSELIPDAMIVEQAHVTRPIPVLIYRNPDALVFKGAHREPLAGVACGECGFVEFYVSDPASLLAAHRRRKTGG